MTRLDRALLFLEDAVFDTPILGDLLTFAAQPKAFLLGGEFIRTSHSVTAEEVHVYEGGKQVRTEYWYFFPGDSRWHRTQPLTMEPGWAIPTPLYEDGHLRAAGSVPPMEPTATPLSAG